MHRWTHSQGHTMRKDVVSTALNLSLKKRKRTCSSSHLHNCKRLASTSELVLAEYFCLTHFNTPFEQQQHNCWQGHIENGFLPIRRQGWTWSFQSSKGFAPVRQNRTIAVCISGDFFTMIMIGCNQRPFSHLNSSVSALLQCGAHHFVAKFSPKLITESKELFEEVNETCTIVQGMIEDRATKKRWKSRFHKWANDF